MANEVKFGWVTGATLTFGVYTGAGVQREVATAMTETPAASGLYLGTPTTIIEDDVVIVSDATGVIGAGQWLLDPMNDKIDTIDTNVDLVLIAENKALFSYDESAPIEPAAIVIIE